MVSQGKGQHLTFEEVYKPPMTWIHCGVSSSEYNAQMISDIELMPIGAEFVQRAKGNQVKKSAGLQCESLTFWLFLVFSWLFWYEVGLKNKYLNNDDNHEPLKCFIFLSE